ncbi:MAG TPA: FAD-binding oxidoreductase [Candidatus Limnocylindrales bacterium]|nr:FAD-binding oxidoreductase [Candidatus Limnocylindrales bacterium]
MPDPITALEATVTGRVIRPASPEYDDARRTFNALIDRRPAAIVRCASHDDVSAAIACARDNGLALGVRGGGHSVAGLAIVENGLVIDLSEMRGVSIRADDRVAHVQGGAQWQDLDAPALDHGLGVPGGVYGDTGVAGLTLGGGIGFLMGIGGFTCDNLVGARVATADGSVVEGADDPELLWALRGGGGNFGVVTRFDLGLIEVPPMYGGLAHVPLGDGATLRRLATLMPEAADAVLPMLVLLLVDGVPTVEIQYAYAGGAAAGAAFATKLLGETADRHPGLRPCTYLDIQSMNAIEPFGRRHYWSSTFVADLTAELVETLVRLVDTIPTESSGFLIEPVHGLARRIPSEHAAFGNRTSRFHVSAIATWDDAALDVPLRAWSKDATAEVAAWSTGGLYANYAMPEEAVTTAPTGRTDRARAVYPPSTYARLQAVKARYDPDNLFRGNLNITPASSTVAATRASSPSFQEA